MDVVRGSLREFGRILSVLTGGLPDGDERPQPRRGVVWIVVQVAALALTIAALLAVAGLFVDAPPDPRSPATTWVWALPGFVLALPLAVHWLAGPPRRTAALLGALPAGVVVAVAVAPLAPAGLPLLWTGLPILTAGALTAAAAYGALAPCPPRA